MDQGKFCEGLLGKQAAQPPPTKKGSRKSKKLFKFSTVKKGDPIKKHKKDERKEILMQKKFMKKLAETARRHEEKGARCTPSVLPSFGKRFELRMLGITPIEERPKTVVLPEPKSLVQKRIKDREEYMKMLNFCTFKPQEMGMQSTEVKLKAVAKVPSPNIGTAYVTPRKPSFFASDIYPEPPLREVLKQREPSSNIFINEKFPYIDIVSSFELLVEGKSRSQYGKEIFDMEAPPCLTKKGKKKKKRAAKKKKKVKEKADVGVGRDSEKNKGKDEDKLENEILSQFDEIVFEGEEEGEEEIPLEPLTRMFRRQVSQISKATSLNEKELLGFKTTPDYELDQCPFIDKVLQKFRRDSELEKYKKPKRKIKRGTLESHSFTKILQKTLKHFYYGLVYANIHQGDEHFSSISRNQQGICMPLAAYCFATEIHPSRWTDKTLDFILELGDKLYRDSVENMHLHEALKELKPSDLHKFIYMGEDKYRFAMDDPYVSGLIKSAERNVYNITKGLQIFFAVNHAGIVQSNGLDVMIWKDHYFYLFDARPRTKDLYPDDTDGCAILTIVYDIESLVTIFLERSKLGNWPFIISKVSVMKKLKKYQEEDEDDIKEGSTYNVISPNKAVVQGSFDLADKCFGFSRSKQSLTIAVIALVYSRITPPNSWHRRTLNKIMVLGNQLYTECAEQELILEMNLDHLPALFTIGPYLIEIFIYANRIVDVVWKKGKCSLNDALDCFFSKNTNAILQIGKSTLAVWQQRNMFYCFDPYSRNNQGTACRNGVGCVSMHTDIDGLVQTIGTNFPDNMAVFYIHALKVLKIHRDPVMSRVFPKSAKMDDISPETLKKYKMKKSNKKATQKPVTIDLTQKSIKRLLPGESPEPSLQEVCSDVDSLTKEQLPTMRETCHVLKKLPPTRMAEYADVIDLDSPSLSDTQIEPRRPLPEKCLEEVTLMDLDSFVLTQEEMEMIEVGEGEAGRGGGKGEGEGEGEGGNVEDLDELDNTYLAMNEFAQVHPESLDSYHSKISQMVNTEVTAAFLPIARKVLKPTDILEKKTMKRCMELKKMAELEGLEPDTRFLDREITIDDELMKQTNFVDLPDDSQLIRGSKNIVNFDENVDETAPYICIVAAAVAKKYSIGTWNSDIIDYVLSGGSALHELANVRFDQVPKLEIPKISLGRDNYRVLIDYLYDSQFTPTNLEKSLINILFTKNDVGIVITTYYSAAVFFKNHLFYLFDCYGNNEVGLSEGPNNKGTACFTRFKFVEHMVQRIMHNKTKRETAESFKFSRFLLFSVKVETIRPGAARTLEPLGPDVSMDAGEDDGEDAPPPPKTEGGKPKEDLPEPKNVVGFKLRNGVFALLGTKALKGRSNSSADLKEDHFVCICAGLMLSCCSIEKWDTRRVNYVIDHGLAIFAHADNLAVVDKRIIKNVLVDNYFFDIIVRRKEIPVEVSSTFSRAAGYMLHKHNQVIVQFPNCCYVLYKYKESFYLFDPYPCQPDGKQSSGDDGFACWAKLRELNQVTKRIKQSMAKGSESYSFYRFEITSIKKAPRKVVLEQKLMLYELNKQKVPEKMLKPLFEEADWLKVDPIPWSRRKKKSACGFFRCKREYMWNFWDTEYPNDLFSLLSSINQFSNKFSDQSRGKQTICNCVCAIGMTVIYELSEWNSPIMDCILINGDAYFLDCFGGNRTQDYEIAIDDLVKNCTIFPYSFEVDYYPVIDGTMFVHDKKKYNLYKALRFFFENYERRCGLLCAVRGDVRRYVAFGKIQDREYFMFDSQSYGPPMFLERESKAYALRCSSLPRLLHVLILCLRGGDFFIYNIECKNFQPISN